MNGNHIVQVQSRMKGDQPRPNDKSGADLRVGVELANSIQIHTAVRRQNVVEDRLNVSIHAPAARKGFGRALGIDGHGMADFRESRGKFALAQQKIAVTPGNFRRKWIHALGLQECVASGRHVAFQLIRRGKIEPGIGGTWIERERGDDRT